MEQNRQKLVALADALVEHESLDSEEMRGVLNAPSLQTSARSIRKVT
jgi:ATP-dependent Zn protease